jgi:hypothetical protein
MLVLLQQLRFNILLSQEAAAAELTLVAVVVQEDIAHHLLENLLVVDPLLNQLLLLFLTLSIRLQLEQVEQVVPQLSLNKDLTRLIQALFL